MGEGIYVALSGAIAQMGALDTTATNLANASTAGYERLRPVFREAMAQATANGPAGTTMRAVTTATESLDTAPGPIRVTGNALDLALPQGSYLSVSTTRGERFTRAGSLAVGLDGTLKTAHGDPVLGEDGKEVLSKPQNGPVTISPSGEVWQADAKLGQLRIASFATPDKLSPEGGSLLAATPGSGTAMPKAGQLEIGSVEDSNTSVVGAMTDLVSSSRNFDAFQKAIDAFREADQKVVTTVAGVE